MYIAGRATRDNVVYWKTNGKINNGLQCENVRYRSWRKQGNINVTVSEDQASSLVHKDLTVTTQKNRASLTAARASSGKDESRVWLICIERQYCMGAEIGRLGGYGFWSTVTACDGSNQNEGKMGARYDWCCFYYFVTNSVVALLEALCARKSARKKAKAAEVGRGRISSNGSELAAVVLALRGTSVTKPMLYLCDHQALLKAAKIWEGEGRNAM